MATTANFGAKATAQQVSTSNLSDADVAALEAIYSLRQRYQVLAYIENRPFLLPILLKEAPIKIKEFFPNASLALEKFVDVEIPDWEQLLIVIIHNFDLDEELDKLDELDFHWLASQPDHIVSSLHLSTEQARSDMVNEQTQSESAAE